MNTDDDGLELISQNHLARSIISSVLFRVNLWPIVQGVSI